MKTKQEAAEVLRKLFVGIALLATAFTAHAQVQTRTNTTSGTATTAVKVERGTIVYVSGNNVVVKAEDGSLLHFDNVPESTTVMVDGKELNVHQLTPGMAVERQTITTVTPKMITTVKSVTGTVWHISPPNSVILKYENGKTQQFTIPKGTKFIVEGKSVDAWGLRSGMKVSAQQVTEVPETEFARQVKRTGIAPPPPPAPDEPVLVASVRAPAAEPVPSAPEEAAPTSLPKTGSYFPLLGLLGAISAALGLGLMAGRTRKA